MPMCVECAEHKCLTPVTVLRQLPGVIGIRYNSELRSFAEFLYMRDTPVFLELQMRGDVLPLFTR
jgi:hypothetical protein